MTKSGKSINFAADTEDYQPSERISPELVNGYRRNTQNLFDKLFPKEQPPLNPIPDKERNGGDIGFPVISFSVLKLPTDNLTRYTIRTEVNHITPMGNFTQRGGHELLQHIAC